MPISTNERVGGSVKEQLERIAELEHRLAEAEETLEAIRQGGVDAVVISGPAGEQVYALEGPDHPYRVLVEEMHQGTVTLDPDGLILYCNRQFASMMKTSVENIIGSRMARFLTAEEYGLFSALIAMAAGGHSQGELNLLAGNDELVPVLLSLNRLEVSGVENLCAVITDLTEARRNEAIVKEEQLSRLILEQTAEPVIVIDAHGKILRAGEAARRLAGSNVLFQDFSAVFPISDLDGPITVSRLLLGVRSQKGVRSVEVNMNSPEGRANALLLSASPLWSPGRELLGCVLTLTDITERKHAEEELAQQAEQLAQSNSDLRQFAYSASHDLQEPLRHLAIYTELLQQRYEGKLDTEADQFIQRTIDAAHRMERLLKDLLSYTHAADAPQGAAASVDGNAVLAKVLGTFEQQIEKEHAVIASDPLPELCVHEVHLSQLFQNLISNSFKYHGNAPLKLHVWADPAEDGTWRLSVEDNGIGIDGRYHQQVFGLFKRLHGSSRYTGNGIGLAICQKIVQRYGGKIWVESRSGEGSIFRFTLPGKETAHAKA
jgi:PAS domain S-box-containing protein